MTPRHAECQHRHTHREMDDGLQDKRHAVQTTRRTCSKASLSCCAVTESTEWWHGTQAARLLAGTMSAMMSLLRLLCRLCRDFADRPATHQAVADVLLFVRAYLTWQ